MKIIGGRMFYKVTLRIAALYNIAWGIWVVFFPNQFFDWIGMERVNHVFIWQCLGMVIGLYGLAYWVASNDYIRYWPIIAIGLLGKIFGPLGFIYNYISGKIPFNFILHFDL